MSACVCVCVCVPDLVGRFPRVVALGIHDPKVHGGIGAPQEVSLFPQLHRPLVVLLKLLIVPGQAIGRGYKTLWGDLGGGAGLIE